LGQIGLGLGLGLGLETASSVKPFGVF